MQIWRKTNPICPGCGILVADHSSDEAFDCEAIIHRRLQETRYAVSLLQDASTGLAAQYCLAIKKEGRRRHERKQRTS